MSNTKITRMVVVPSPTSHVGMATERVTLVDADGNPWTPEVGAGQVVGSEVLLTGMTAGTNTPVAATDTVNQAIAKLQAQIDALP